MESISNLKKRAEEFLKRLKVIETKISKKMENLNRFSGEDSVRIYKAVDNVLSTITSLNIKSYQFETLTSVPCEEESDVQDFKDYLDWLRKNIPDLEKVSEIEPAERAITPREALGEINELKKQLKQL